MLDEQISSDIGLWNLDGLPKNRDLKGDGRIHAVDLKARNGRVTRVGVLESELLGTNPTLVAFLPDERVLLGVNIDRPDRVYELKGWKKDEDDAATQKSPRQRAQKSSAQKQEEYVDVAAHGQYLCVLSLNRQESKARAEVFYFYGNKLQQLGASRELPLHSLSADSRVALSLTTEDTKKPLPDTAYVVSGAKSQITVLPLSGKRPTRTIGVKVGRGPEKLGKEVYVVHDPVKRSLILSDTRNHRIVEVSLDDGTAEVVCGTGDALVSDDEELALTTPVSSPKGIALYRHAKVIDKDFLESPLMVEYDQVKPRAILFVESGSSSVRKLLDLPTQAAWHRLPDEPTLYTLMGRRKDSPKAAGQSGRDLRSYALADPVDVAASRRGELLVGCAKMLYFLRPLTSVSESVGQERIAAAEQDYTS